VSSLANIADSLRIPEADPGRKAPRGGAWGEFSLVAERSPRGAGRAAGMAAPLFARTATPSGGLPRGYDVVPERPTTPLPRTSRRAILATIVAALALHLSILLALIARPAPTAEEANERLGMETGEPLNVSVITADDLKRLSSDPFKQQGNASPEPAPLVPPQPESQAEPTPPQPVQEAQPQPPSPPEPETKSQEQKTAAASPLDSKTDEKEKPFDPEAYAAAATRRFAHQLDQVFERPAQREASRRPATRAGNVKAFRPGASSSGKSNEFERAVIWALAATKPLGNGKWGSVVVTFAVGETGRVDGLRLMKSSGDNWLDQGALMAVRQARLPAPPSGLAVGDRTFVVEYISTPGS